jgi:predicted permease
LRNELIYLCRSLYQAPVFVWTIILSLGVAFSVNTTLLSVVRGVLQRPLGVPDADRLVSIYLHDSGRPAFGSFPYPAYVALASADTPFEGLCGFFEFQEPARIGDRSDIIAGEFITPDYFSTVRVQPRMGRFISPVEFDARAPVVVISERLWRRRLSAVASPLGAVIRIKDRPVEVIGVAPDAFRGLSTPGVLPTDVWVAYSIAPQVSRRFNRADLLSAWDANVVRLRGRLRHDATQETARAAVESAVRHAATEAPELRDKSVALRRTDSEFINAKADGYARVMSGSLLIVSGLIVLAVCANVVTLLLARATDRSTEVAIRQALGAPRSHVVRIAVGESTMLAVLGGAVGIALACFIGKALAWTVPSYGQVGAFGLEPLIDLPVLVTALSIAGGVGALCGIVPAIRMSRTGGAPLLNGESHATAGESVTRWRSALVGTEITICVAVAVLAALFLRAAHLVTSRDLGFQSSGLHIVGVDASAVPGLDGLGLHTLSAEILTRASTAPGVTRATLIDFLPIGTRRDVAMLSMPVVGTGQPARRYSDLMRVGAEYFSMVKIPILRGRSFTEADGRSAPPVAIVSELSARSYWPSSSPIGTTMDVQIGTKVAPMLIVGVAADTDVRFVGERRTPLTYVPFAQQPSPEFKVLAEGRADADPPLAVAIETQVRAVDNRLAVVEAVSLDEWLDVWRYPYTIGGSVLGSLALVALVVCVGGLYGLSHFAAATRLREIGIRLCLGATRQQVIRLILRRQWVLLAVGVACGAALASVLVVGLQRTFFGMIGFEFRPMLAAIAVTLAVGATAAVLPALKAAGASPAETLRRP